MEDHIRGKGKAIPFLQGAVSPGAWDKGSGDALRDLGKKVYALYLSRNQAGFFWYEYAKSQARTMDDLRECLGACARRIVKQIENANDNLAALGARLYKIQRERS